MTFDEIKSLAIALSHEEQFRLLDHLSENLESVYASSELTDEQRTELDRRLADSDANPDSLIAIDEVKRRLST